MRLLCAASPRAELRSAGKCFFATWLLVFVLYPSASQGDAANILLADVPIALTFSYSISYDTCRGHAAFTLFFVRGLASWVVWCHYACFSQGLC